jgi:cell division protein FtsZ
MRIAESGIEELQKYVDTLIIIPNQNLFRIANERTTFADAFKMADDVLHSGVRGVTDLMVMPGLINLDFADIRTVMSEMGKAMMGTGEAEGERRAIDAAEAAINNPLLEDVSMKGARGVLINITGGTDMTLFEVDEAANRIREEVDPEANIIFGSTFDEKLAGRMRISVVATGIEAEALREPRPVIQLVSDRSRGGQPAATPAPQPAAALASEPAPAAAIETAAVKSGAFIAPRPVEVAQARPPIVTPPPAPEPVATAPQKAVKSRGPSLFERVTGVARRSQAPAEPPARTPAPSPAQPRLGPLDPADRISFNKDDDMLDIPAFLRRQAN